jgi:hypothetical protein
MVEYPIVYIWIAWILVCYLIIQYKKYTVMTKRNTRSEKEEAHEHFKKMYIKKDIINTINNLYRCKNEDCKLYFRHHQIIKNFINEEPYACPHCEKEIEPIGESNDPWWITEGKITVYDKWLDHHIHCSLLSEEEREKKIQLFKISFEENYIKEQNEKKDKYNRKHNAVNWIENLKIKELKDVSLNSKIEEMEIFKKIINENK